MNTEQKARAYDEALERARRILCNIPEGSPIIRDIETIFPELCESEDKTKSAIDLISEERERQISKGFNWRHDDEHDCHQLSDAAIVYAAPAPLRYQVMNWWPWDKKWLKEDDSFTTEGRIRELVKAGALIVAEIERLQRTINNASKPIESEDERIRKGLIRHLEELLEWKVGTTSPIKVKEHYDAWIAYLEKQKEEEEGYEAIPVESTLEYKLGFKAGKESEKQKEQKEIPLMNGDADLYFDEWNQQKQNPTKRQCFEEGIRYAQGLQKEQKPAEWSEEDEAHRNFILESLEDQIRFCKKDEEGAYYAKQIRTAQNWLKYIPERFNLQQKPTAKINGEPIPTENQTVKVGDDETEVQKAYREGKNAGRKEVFDHPEYYGLQLRRMYDYETGKRNPEWSEEDKEWLSEVYFTIDHSMYSEDERRAMKKYIDSLRKNRKPCDVDEFSLTLKNCLSADSELTEEQADTRERFLVRCKSRDMFFKVGDIRLAYKAYEPSTGYFVYIDESKGSDVMSYDARKFNKHFEIIENKDEPEFNPKPGEKFWVRCKTNKTENLWFDKDDERPAYAQRHSSGVMYAVHVNMDGTGSCILYADKEQLLRDFELVYKPEQGEVPGDI